MLKRRVAYLLAFVGLESDKKPSFGLHLDQGIEIQYTNTTIVLLAAAKYTIQSHACARASMAQSAEGLCQSFVCVCAIVD